MLPICLPHQFNAINSVCATMSVLNYLSSIGLLSHYYPICQCMCPGTNLSSSVICEQMKRNQINLEKLISSKCLPLSLRSRFSRFESFNEVDKLAVARLEELVAELGVPLGKGTTDEPLMLAIGKEGTALGPSKLDCPEAAAAAFKEPDERANKPAAVEFEAEIPAAKAAEPGATAG